MPESAQKRRLISKLNDANGYGTPASLSIKNKKRKEPSKLKYLLTPKSKTHGNDSKHQKKEGKHHGSYNVKLLSSRAKAGLDEKVATTPLSSYKRQDSRGSSSMVTFSDASPVLKTSAKPPKPEPPPRVSSLKKSQTKNSQLETPRCRKPLMALSPMITLSSPGDSDLDIEKEARLLLTGEMDPSDSMTYFLNGGEGTPAEEKAAENKGPQNEVLSPKSRKKSITELAGPNPLKGTPMRNCDNVYFETDF